ncbi:DUF5412 family protein [Bacillus sp. FSL K6-3431]|uniref:DUF5412 family protein n=1 Tax=Bacillus sp. FSL K6-3431 TaxID=2921500 RepID=UPI0040469C0B
MSRILLLHTKKYRQWYSIQFLEDNKKEFNDKTIYWLNPSEDEISIEWKGNDSIVINGTTINITDEDTYFNWKKDDSL